MTRHASLRTHVARALACLFSVLFGALTASPALAEARAPNPRTNGHMEAGWPSGSAGAAPGGGWAWPLAGPPAVLRGFQRPPEPWLVGHRGVDLRGSPGYAVLAAGPGRVSFAGSVAGKPVVVVTHRGGLRTTYEPVIAAVATDDEVSTGSVLGRLSAAGSHCLPAACLHWGARRGDTYLDPLALVGATPRVRLLPVWSRGSALTSAARAAGFASAARVGALNRVRAAAGSER